MRFSKIFLLFIFLSCNDSEIINKYESYKLNFNDIGNKSIEFPANLQLLKDDNHISGKSYKIILFIKPDCSSCITKMNDWKLFLKESKFKNTNCAFIVLGKLNTYFEEYMASDKLPFSIYSDTSSQYFYKNGLAQYYNTPLLLNVNNKVVMAGDPEKNKGIRELYAYAISNK